MRKFLPLLLAGLLCAGCSLTEAPKATVPPMEATSAPVETPVETAVPEATAAPETTEEPAAEGTAAPEATGLSSENWFSLAADGVFYGDTFCFTPPAGWMKAAGTFYENVYVLSPDGTTTGASISLVVTENPGSPEDITAEGFENQVETRYKENGMEADCRVLTLENISPEGRRGVYMVSVTEVEGASLTQYQYIIFEETRGFSITCNDTTGKWEKEFSALGDTLSFYE